jgi:hypothetical protein
MTPELLELEALSAPHLRADGTYDAGIIQIAARYAQMAAENRRQLELRIADLEESEEMIVQRDRLLISCQAALVNVDNIGISAQARQDLVGVALCGLLELRR